MIICEFELVLAEIEFFPIQIRPQVLIYWPSFNLSFNILRTRKRLCQERP